MLNFHRFKASLKKKNKSTRNNEPILTSNKAVYTNKKMNNKPASFPFHQQCNSTIRIR